MYIARGGQEPKWEASAYQSIFDVARFTCSRHEKYYEEVDKGIFTQVKSK